MGRTFAAILLATLMLPLALAAYLSEYTFLERAVIDQAINTKYWGEARAAAIKEGALNLFGRLNPVRVAPPRYEAPTDAPSGQLAQSASHAFQRVGETAYVRSLAAAVYLFCHRLSSVWQWIPLLAVFIVLALSDGEVERRVKSKEFGIHSPAVHGVFAYLFVIGLGGGLFTLFWPITIHPLALGAALMTLTAFARVVVAQFHRHAL